MSADLPNEVCAEETPEPSLRPVLGSTAELPGPSIRLAMAREREKQKGRPHSLPGMIALGSALASAFPLWVKLVEAWRALDQYQRHPVGPPPPMAVYFVPIVFIAFLFLVLGLDFGLAIISPLFCGSRRVTSWLAFEIV